MKNIHSAQAGSMKHFVINLKTNGKIHLVVDNCRIKCGWHRTKGKSIAYQCQRIYRKEHYVSELCKRCFDTKSEDEDSEEIEQYDESP
jgi:hypothetical protein